MYYTIGQRKGLNLGGGDNKIFVVKKDIENNILYVAKGNENKYLYRIVEILKQNNVEIYTNSRVKNIEKN